MEKVRKTKIGDSMRTVTFSGFHVSSKYADEFLKASRFARPAVPILSSEKVELPKTRPQSASQRMPKKVFTCGLTSTRA